MNVAIQSQMKITSVMASKQKALFSTTIEVMKHRKAPPTLALHPEFRIKPLYW